MSCYVYFLKYNRYFIPQFVLGSPTMSFCDYHEVRSSCRCIARYTGGEGVCSIYRAKCGKTELNTLFNCGAIPVKVGENWLVGTTCFEYIGRYSHNRDRDCNSEFYADWTLGRDAETRHFMYVVTPIK